MQVIRYAVSAFVIIRYFQCYTRINHFLQILRVFSTQTHLICSCTEKHGHLFIVNDILTKTIRWSVEFCVWLDVGILMILSSEYALNFLGGEGFSC